MSTRIIKRRTVSHDLAEADRVLVNGKVAKPGLKLKLNDIIELTLGDKIVKIKVLNLNEYANSVSIFAWNGEKFDSNFIRHNLMDINNKIKIIGSSTSSKEIKDSNRWEFLVT